MKWIVYVVVHAALDLLWSQNSTHAFPCNLTKIDTPVKITGTTGTLKTKSIIMFEADHNSQGLITGLENDHASSAFDYHFPNKNTL